MKPVVDIQIFNTFAKVITHPESGASKVKIVTLDDIAGAFSSKIVETPIFPIWVVYYKNAGTFLDIVTAREVGKFRFRHSGLDDDNDCLEFHIPYFYWTWKIQNREDGTMAVASVKLHISYEAPSKDTLIFQPNLNNQYENGRMCWGSVSNGDHFTDLSQLRIFENRWLGATRNNDNVSNEGLGEYDHIIFGNEKEFTASKFVSRYLDSDESNISLEKYINQLGNNNG